MKNANTNIIKNKKRFYEKEEIVWVIDLKTKGKVKSIDKENLKMIVTYEKNGKELEYEGKLWNFDKFKSFDLKEDNTLLFAKMHKDAVIPKKAGDGEAGYDVWACLEPNSFINFGGEEEDVFEMYLKKLTPNLIPTGIATCVNKNHYLNFSNERGSTGKLGMLLLSGIVDSSYRNEVFVNIVPLFKDVLITSETDKIQEMDNLILFPYSKAICQMVGYRLGDLTPKEIKYDELRKIPSSRGLGKLGSTGH